MTGPPLGTNWSGRVHQVISGGMSTFSPKIMKTVGLNTTFSPKILKDGGLKCQNFPNFKKGKKKRGGGGGGGLNFTAG